MHPNYLKGEAETSNVITPLRAVHDYPGYIATYPPQSVLPEEFPANARLPRAKVSRTDAGSPHNQLSFLLRRHSHPRYLFATGALAK